MDLKKISERLRLISEYSYYFPKLNEEGEEDATTSDASGETQTLEAGDDLELSDESLPGLDDLESADVTDEVVPGDDIESSDEEVEIDVSEIVDSVEQGNEAVGEVDAKVSNMGTEFSNFVASMQQQNQQLANQLAALEKEMKQELVKRNPTPHEQLMLRSMSSYPYNVPLSDYWKPTPSQPTGYEIMNPNKTEDKFDVKVTKTPDNQEDEFILTDDDIDDNYNEWDIKKSI
jgi:hypothetical protein